MASRIRLPERKSAAPATGARRSDSQTAKAEHDLSLARVKVLGEALTTIGKWFDFLRAREESQAVIVRAHADVARAKANLESTRLLVEKEHRELDGIEKLQDEIVALLRLLVDEATRTVDFEARRRIVGEATQLLGALARNTGRS